MKYSMSDYLNVAGPRLSPELISPEAFAEIQDKVAILPPCAGSGFECRLGEIEPRADFLMRIQTFDGSRAAFAGRNPDVAPPAVLLRDPVWQRVHHFCSQWANPEHPLHTLVKDFWLEFDVSSSPPALPTPSIFFGPRPEHEDQQSIVALATGIMRGLPEPTPVPPSVQRCYEALPRGSAVYQVGMMLSRQSDALRLCVMGIAPSRLGAYLHDIGWSGPRAELEALVASLTPSIHRICLALDVGEAVEPKVGLECYMDEHNLRSYKAKWAPFLEKLCERGLCRPEKRDGLLSWFGISTHQADEALWPSNLLQASSARTDGALSTFIRYLNHIKIVFTPGKPLEAKAYPGLMHSWGLVRASAAQT